MSKMRTVLLAGASLLVSAGAAIAQSAATLPQISDNYFVTGQEALLAHLAQQPNVNRAKNIILFVGDGFSVSTLTAARIYDGQTRGVDGESNALTIDLLPYSAFSRTYSHDGQVSDSAPTATAMVSGIKTNNGVIGVDYTVTQGDCAAQQGHSVTTIFELAETAGLSTGVISTARITHATPAATYAHTANRDWEADYQVPADAVGCTDIAAQLVDWPAGNGFEVILGGGRDRFFPNTLADTEDTTAMGRRTDGRNLVEEWLGDSNSSAYVWNAAQLEALDLANTTRLFGLFERDHMEYELDRARDAAGEPSLAEMTTAAIEVLEQNGNGFILMVEGGRIDHAHHAGNAARALADTVAFDQAIRAAMASVDLNETLIVVTADHGHTLTINGYPGRGNPILGLAADSTGLLLGADEKPYTTLSYANGPGAIPGERPDLTNVDTTSIDYLQPALVPIGSETHSGEDVGIFAQGPYAHLFSGVVEQNYIYHVMAFASQIPARAAAASLALAQ
ncbi:MAG: alkaline phosphatase [Bauldia sp.]|nr:alkaline phosphatase [Bauldia sp.]